jgi:integrase
VHRPEGPARPPIEVADARRSQSSTGGSGGNRVHAYVVVSLLTGARTEEMRALTWDRVDVEGDPNADPPVPPSIQVWRSVREGGDRKTRKSRRTLALPRRCVAALKLHRDRQGRERAEVGARWKEHGLVFASKLGTEMDAADVRRGFRRVTGAAGLDPAQWTPASYDMASSRSSPMAVCRWRRSPTCASTRGRR